MKTWRVWVDRHEAGRVDVEAEGPSQAQEKAKLEAARSEWRPDFVEVVPNLVREHVEGKPV